MFLCPSGYAPDGLPFRESHMPRFAWGHAVCLAKMISHMPNLRHLDMELSVTSQIRRQRLSLQRMEMVFKVLILLWELVPPKVQFRVVVKCFGTTLNRDPVTAQIVTSLKAAESFLSKNNITVVRNSGLHLSAVFSAKIHYLRA